MINYYNYLCHVIMEELIFEETCSWLDEEIKENQTNLKIILTNYVHKLSLE